MVDKTTEQITRTCFAWRPTYEVPANKEVIAWFEILRSSDGAHEATTLNVVREIRPKRKAGKSYKTYIENSFVAPRLMTIETFGIAPLVSPLHPIVIATPPPWLDSYFECLASKLEAAGKSAVQFTAENFAALVQDTVILITTPKAPPPMVSLTYKGL
jgi:hypothetical protein